MSKAIKVASKALLVLAVAMPVVVSAQDSSNDGQSSPGFFSGLFQNVDFSIGGFIRPEVAVRTTDQENPYNQGGNPYNNITAQRQAYVPPTSSTTAVNGVLNTLGVPVQLPAIPLGSFSTLAFPSLIAPNTVRRPIENSNNVFNYHVVHGETEVGIKLGNDLKIIGRVRMLADFSHYSDFNGASVDNMYGGISGGEHPLYGGAPNHYQYIVEGEKHPEPLVFAGPNYMVDFPALVLDYNRGPLNVRIGNQSIAWGQAIFFRVLDVPNGLDLRRHSILDYAQEEFADKRTPSLAIRVGYQATDDLLVDSFVEKFQPTVFGNPNTSYNVIPSQFTVQDMYHEQGLDDFSKLNYGLRLKGNFGQFGFQAIASRRYNPDGVFRWTTSNVNKNLPATYADGSPNVVGQIVNVANGGNSGAQLAQTPFEASPGGVYSADEWFHYAGLVRLDGIKGLNAAINEFQPATGNVFASPVTNYRDAYNELNTFFTASGGLRGHIAREYFQETVLGLGGSYVTEAEPGSVWDQIIFNLETSYTLGRTFTSTDLSRNYPREDSLVSALVIEKYHRFTAAFPATYFVLQYMHRTKDDLFGRLLTGYGAQDSYADSTTSGVQKIEGGANYVVFAFQQPFPQDVYRVGFATLYDPRGGILVQPGIQYKPSHKWSFDLFYSYINGHLGGNPNNNVLSTADFADEVTARVGYQF